MQRGNFREYSRARLTLRQLRNKLGLTQVEMAAKLKVGLSTYTDWEQGRGLRPVVIALRLNELILDDNGNPARK